MEMKAHVKVKVKTQKENIEMEAHVKVKMKV